MKWMTSICTTGIVLAVLASAAMAVGYSIPWSVIDSGGGHKTSASYQLDDSIGQTAIGISTSTSYTLQAGFLYGIPFRYSTTGTMVKYGWNCFSLPAIPENSDPTVVFAPIDVAASSLQYWKNNVDGGGWQSYGSLFGWTGPAVMGTAYWFLHLGAPTDLSYYGYPVSGTQQIVFGAASSAPHWVMFGHMQGSAIDCANITFSRTSQPTPVNWQTANTNGIVEGKALGFSNAMSNFFTAGPTIFVPEKSILEPWYGYWLLINTNEAVTMNFPAP